MNDNHPLYDQIIEKLVNTDQRSILPKPGLRMDRMVELLSDDGEKDTEVFKIKVEGDEEI